MIFNSFRVSLPGPVPLRSIFQRELSFLSRFPVLSVCSVVNKPLACLSNPLRATILTMKIALGSDHAGFELKEKIKQKLDRKSVV